MRLPVIGDRLIHRFNPMDDKSREELTMEFTAYYNKTIASAVQKKLENETNIDVADYKKQKLKIVERLFLFCEEMGFRYLVAIFFPLLIAFFVRKQQINEPDIDEDEDEDDDDYRTSDKEDLKSLIKKLSRKL